MLSGEKILITGPAGRIAFGLAKTLCRDNEVWGIARFSDPASREEVEALGRDDPVRRPRGEGTSGNFRATSRISCTSPPTSARTTSVACVSTRKERVSCLSHCRQAKAALVMSTVTVYKPHPDPWHPFTRGRPDR